MILLWGVRSDPPVAAVAAALGRRSVKVAWLDQGATDTSMEFTVANAIAGRLQIGSWEADLGSIAGAYLRPFETQRLPRFRNGAAESARLSNTLLLDDALLSWAEMTSAIVLNRPSAMASNNSKPYQLSLMRRLGLRVPETLITTDAAAADAFWHRHGNVVYKSLSGVRSRVARLEKAQAARLRDLVWCPTQFQQYVPGDEYRVHIVGRMVFVTRIVCGADDYRYPGEEPVRLEPSRLPLDVESACLRASHGLGLPLAGIDLRLTPENEWYALEVNPSPGFTYYASQTGQPIADAIADLLCSGGGVRM
jgi:glutathione synthase/RimK-type ligase-like ATP-grasp enzyme